MIDDADKDIVKQIVKKLADIEKRERVKIIYAAESGSRAWGFPSPDSDYDVRFVYVRQPEDYLRLDKIRDVIEAEMNEVYDINGWDITKTLHQLYKSNSVVLEWNASPIVYKCEPEWNLVQKIIPEYFINKQSLYHYFSIAHNTIEKSLSAETVSYKKYFYALRPLLAMKYIEKHDTPAPMTFMALLEDADISAELKARIIGLIELKKNVSEKDKKPHIPEIITFIRTEYAIQKDFLETVELPAHKSYDNLNKTFLKILTPSG